MKLLMRREQGVGLIEVLIALVIVLISALALSNIQTSASVNVRMSDTRFKANEHALDILELLRANATEAKAGVYNSGYDGTVVVDSNSAPTLVRVSTWKGAVAQKFVNGGAKIDCTAVRCLVSIRWKEAVSGSMTDQFFDLTGLL